jgi:preprotein translocase subunit SecE
VSDERDSAGSASDDNDADTDITGQTAVATQPLRPTGKRSRRGAAAADSDATVTTVTGASKNGSGKKSAEKSGPARNPFVFVITFLQQVVAELRKVIWPNRKQMVSYTSVVLVFLAFMVTLIGLADLGLAKLVLLVFG